MSNLIQAAKDQIAALTTVAYQTAAEKGLLPSGLSLSGTIEIPKDVAHGDYATNIALTAAKAMKRNPREIGQVILDHLDLTDSYFASAEIAGAGFLNFRLSPRWYGTVLQDIEKEGLSYGQVDVGAGTRVMVEFVSANPTGTMTIGNARGGVLGDALASILQRAGYDVWREFYVNDAGNQVNLFGRSLEARYLQLLYGEDACVLPEDGYHGEDIWDVAKLFLAEHGDQYAKVDPDIRQEALRAFGLAHNIEKMRVDLERYGIQYDCWFRESTLHESGYVDETVQILIDKGFTYEKDNALWLKVTELGGEKDEVLRRGNGGYTYFAVDIAYHRNKFEVRGFDQVIDVLGADHHGHALRFKKAITALGIDNSRLNFLIMQLVRLVRDGETVKVSKRSGKSITLSDLLDEISKDAARFFFNSKPTTHLEFDMGLAVRQDSENPVYYVQYAHARICSLIVALAAQGDTVRPAKDIDPSLLSTPVEQALIKTLAQLPEEIRLAARDYDPSRINRYLVALAGDFHRFYNANRIKDEAPALLHARLKLADTVRSVLANCLSLIGVTAPEKM
ncbi:MAG: arginine--tRNA ligase [Oscillospiraceae bacterium]|jgi:arginyl-tRNA synthetase|nr:arginine--tRNA ligase [Oscillospiraceae bacterium]